jgi:hypothetical protein
MTVMDAMKVCNALCAFKIESKLVQRSSDDTLTKWNVRVCMAVTPRTVTQGMAAKALLNRPKS